VANLMTESISMSDGVSPDVRPTISRGVKPRLLVVELWGVGDLVLATPFLRAAVERFEVTLLAKPHAVELGRRFWPEVSVVPFVAPWTAFRRKYVLWRWPWPGLWHLQQRLADERFAVAVSARPDPRDHALIFAIGATDRIGFPRFGSTRLLTRSLPSPDPLAHRYEYWRTAGKDLGVSLPVRDPLGPCRLKTPRRILLHTGAGQPIRSWPIERYVHLGARLRRSGFEVLVACDQGQRETWIRAGESNVAVPRSVTELMALIDSADVFVGNDSGPGHLAAACGLPTFSIFGPQLSEWFAPLSSRAECVDGKPCPFRPCSDYCRFPVAYCLERITQEEVWERLMRFLNGLAAARA
jgi:ADP-heptose:LPS heptosyltransferase